MFITVYRRVKGLKRLRVLREGVVRIKGVKGKGFCIGLYSRLLYF